MLQNASATSWPSPDAKPGLFEQHEVWRELLSRIDVGGVMPISFHLRPPSDFEPYVLVTVRMTTPDRDTYDMTTVQLDRPLVWYPLERDRLLYLRRLVHTLYTHEADEMFVLRTADPFRPERPFDPHRGERPGAADR